MTIIDNDMGYAVENREFIKDALPCRVLHRIIKHVSRKVGSYEGTVLIVLLLDIYIYTKTITLYYRGNLKGSPI
jgi:hypothetical protein